MSHRSRNQDGDGSATSHPQFQTVSMLKKQYQDGEDSDEESRWVHLHRFFVFRAFCNVNFFIEVFKRDCLSCFVDEDVRF